ncbi:TPA: hypothetical protein N2903_003986 [Vibrio parahaemolyticus]|uniref:hypothetical protein n=1 Tax=Vibrio parahaemolyticus TaxID=670 RepID=UPI001123454B|nr:hypothetical protein [Vibrio parahaemolyticus]EGR1274162.1 hypothetical protein [Vibrio parahaemolyticus]EHZ2723064.1 hypothetical protein [Vibrio parahaemolyticus]EIO4604139.1 hypothetical protein [Vibrio parahaemolyticus]EIV1595793.1 hypothetical protein [Vibrio parahaemolyticus]EJG2371833.1 hypothetical protein [Vibrio parahaemolyticus]
MHIFVFGNLNVGKSTFCKDLCAKLPTYTLLSLDSYRQIYSDGSLKGEELASRKFVDAVVNTPNAIVEFTGCGIVAERLQAALTHKSGILVVITRNMSENISSLDLAKFEKVPYPIEYKQQQTLEQTIVQLEDCTTLSALELAWQAQIWQSYGYNFEQSFHSFWMQFPLEHHELTERITKFSLGETRIEAAVIYGSLGANQVATDSDIDYFIQSSTSPSYWLDAFQEHFGGGVIHADLLGNKITLRFKSALLVEIVVGKQLSEIELYYRESLIHNCDFTLVKGNLEHRNQLTSFVGKQAPTKNSVVLIASELYFLFCSLPKLVKSGDAYKYSFHTMIIRHYAIQLEHLLLGNSAHNYLPKQAAVNLPDFPWVSFETSPTSIDSNQYLALYQYLKRLFQRLEEAGVLETDKYFSTQTELLHHLE